MTETKWTMHFEDERDMRLAVHAPELLEALRALLEYSFFPDGPDAHREFWSEEERAASEVIAKAEGNAP